MKEKPINRIVGEHVRMLRLSRNLSLESLSDELKISVSTMSNLERGETEMTITRLYDILSFLQVNPIDFFDHVHNGNLVGKVSEIFPSYNEKNHTLEVLNEEIKQISAELNELKNKSI